MLYVGKKDTGFSLIYTLAIQETERTVNTRLLICKIIN